MNSFEGLHVITVAGHEWHWTGSETYTTQRGEQVRLEHWTRECQDCGVDFSAKQKLPRGLAAKFQTALRRARRRAPPVQVIEHLDRRYGALENVRCKRCRPLREGALV